MKRDMVLLALCGLLLVLSGTARAGIVATTGAMTEVSPPLTLTLNSYELVLAIFLERELPAPVPPGMQGYMVDWPVPLPGTDPYGPISGMPMASTIVQTAEAVSVYMIHYDSFELTEGSASGTVTFGPDERIIGVITTDWLLDGTDATLGHPGNTYPTGLEWRGATETVPGAGPDPFTISPDRRTLEVSMNTELSVDQMRILVVPEPGTLGLVAAGGLWLLRRRRRA